MCVCVCVCVCVCRCVCECSFSIKVYISRFALENSLNVAEEHQTDSQISERTLVLCLSESVVNLLCLLAGLTLASIWIPEPRLRTCSEPDCTCGTQRRSLCTETHSRLSSTSTSSGSSLSHLSVCFSTPSIMSVSCHPTTKQYLHVQHYSYITKVD